MNWFERMKSGILTRIKREIPEGIWSKCKKCGETTYQHALERSFFVCPHCGERSEIFGHGGAKAEAEATMTAFLGEIPLDARIRETSDAGTPIVAADPQSPQAESYLALARGVIEKLRQAEGAAAPPVIREE